MDKNLIDVKGKKQTEIRIRTLMLEYDISMTEFARKLGCSVAYASNIVNGKTPAYSKRSLIARIFGKKSVKEIWGN